jgi:hypothetical protein
MKKNKAISSSLLRGVGITRLRGHMPIIDHSLVHPPETYMRLSKILRKRRKKGQI